MSRDPIGTLVASNAGRVSHLIPIRYQRMSESPFAFFRGAASIMAADLAEQPYLGRMVQCCGDCHLLNFGIFATPERRLIFDLNDFDETAPAPFEWDVKRLATSFVIASLENGFHRKQARKAAGIVASAYADHIKQYAEMSPLDVWYSRVDVDYLLTEAKRRAIDYKDRKRIAREIRDAADDHAFNLIENGKIKDKPPLIYHPENPEGVAILGHLTEALASYKQTISAEKRRLLDNYSVIDSAVKVVGIGSVGTRCGVLLLVSSTGDPLLLQVKEARKSVFDPYFHNDLTHQGERVVTGQRLMQAASDLFLGWTTAGGFDFYVRQLRDVKIKPMIEVYNPRLMYAYAEVCGWALARAHARSSAASQIAAYIDNDFAESITTFGEYYAHQTELDWSLLQHALNSGRLAA